MAASNIMTAAELRLAELKALSEAQFQNAVIRTAEDFGFTVYHTHDSRGSRRGYPDLTMVRPSRFIVAELKKMGGKTTPDQDRWLDLCRRCAGVEAYLWYPTDLDQIYEILR